MMTAEPSQGWNVFKQIFADHWEEFKPELPTSLRESRFLMAYSHPY